MGFEHLCDYLGCNEAPTLGSPYCSEHEKKEQLKPTKSKYDFQKVVN